MGYPVWLTGTGDSSNSRIFDLGKISGLDFFSLQLRAIDTEMAGTISYSIISGQLPMGLILDGDTISGNAERIYSTNQIKDIGNEDITSIFTIRARNSDNNSITDRTFKISVTGNFPPKILTEETLLGKFLDGTDVNIQLNASDTNGEPLKWSITGGALPDGLYLDQSGLIYGIMKPIANKEPQPVGWDNGVEWDNDLFELISGSKFFNYNFIASVTDGISIVSKLFTIQVYLFSGLRSDSIILTIDDIITSSDISAVRQPILLTTTLGDSGTFNSDGYFAFQFKGVNVESIPLVYTINSGEIPAGLQLDSTTGWLTGHVPLQVETTKDYTFTVRAASFDDRSNFVNSNNFTLTVLGNLDLSVKWMSDANLGTIEVGTVSYLAVEAVAASGRELTYRLTTDSKLPQGLKFLPDGTLSGRVSFQTFWMDSGTTTFDSRLTDIFVYDNNTTFDGTCKFTVIASDYQNKISAQKTFNVKVKPTVYQPYENLYIRCFPDSELREKFYTTVNNSDIFNPDDVFRPNDPYFGRQTEIKLLVDYGIKSSSLSSYINAMQDRHFNKVFYFGDYKLAQAKDSNGNIIYDVIYVDLIENTKVYTTVNNKVQKKYPAAFTSMADIKPGWTNTRPLPPDQIYLENTRFDIIAPNDLTLMQKDISSLLENSYKNSLPSWMVSIQKNQQILGFTPASVLVYMKPNTGTKALFNLKKYTKFDIKSIPFIADRYVLDNSYSKNFDIATGQFRSRGYTNFDTADGTVIDAKSTSFDGREIVDNYSIPFENDKYLKFPKIGVFTNGQ